MPLDSNRLDSLQRVGAALLLLLSFGGFAYFALISPSAPFVSLGDSPAWISNPRPVATWEPPRRVEDPVPTAHFLRRFEWQGPSSEARLQFRALLEVEVELNGHLARPDAPCLKRTCVLEIGSWLRPGSNLLTARVRNPAGPPLLRAEILAPGRRLATDREWRVRMDDMPETRAMLANDRRPPRDRTSFQSPAVALGQHALPLLGVVLLGAGAFLIGSRRFGGLRARLAEWTLGVVAIAWLYLLFAKIARIPLEYGADGPNHVGYVRWILEHARLPLATDGFQTYQPPLHYAATAALVALADPELGSYAENLLYKLVPWTSGLAMVVIAWALARRLFPSDPVLAAIATAIAGSLPLNLSNASYVSNEALHAALASAAMIPTLAILVSGQATRLRLAAIGLLLGAALATKYTALMIGALMLSFVALRLIVDLTPIARTAGALAQVTLVAAAVSGWVYLRNWLALGDPIPWNLDGTNGFLYWQQPGFHSLPFFTTFGEALRQPYYSSFVSFWDGLYSTTWGEGLPPGAHTFLEPHTLWSYDLMSLCFGIALPATALGLWGYARATRLAFVYDDLGTRLGLTLLVALPYALVATLVITIVQIPSWEAVRGKYLLAGVPAAAVIAAMGFRSFDLWLAGRGLVRVRAAFWGGCIAFWLTCFASFAA